VLERLDPVLPGRNSGFLLDADAAAGHRSQLGLEADLTLRAPQAISRLQAFVVRATQMAAKRKRHEAVEFVDLGLVRRQRRSAQEPELRAVLVGLLWTRAWR